LYLRIPLFLRLAKVEWRAPAKGVILEFSATIRQSGQVSLISLNGRLTFFEVGILRENITRLVREGRKQMVLNLSGLNYIDSSGIGELARMYVLVVKNGGAMRVVGLTSKIEEVLRVTHLSQVFPEFPDEQAALDSFPALQTGHASGKD
jgi:anti-sigma B factor antagonist